MPDRGSPAHLQVAIERSIPSSDDLRSSCTAAMSLVVWLVLTAHILFAVSGPEAPPLECNHDNRSESSCKTKGSGETEETRYPPSQTYPKLQD